MATIKSNIELLYNARNGKRAIIEISITEWRFELKNNSYSAVVNDFAIIDGDRLPVHTEIKHYSKVEIDTLFKYLNNSIDLTEDFSTELDNLISVALLFETQARPVYESTDEDWELTPVV